MGKAVVRYAKGKGVPLSECRSVSALPGLGVRGEVNFDGKVDGSTLLAGGF